MADNVKATLKSLESVDGFIAAAIVDAASGMTLGITGGNDKFDIEVAAAMNTEVVKAKMNAADKLKLDDSIEDILITLSSQYHIIRPMRSRPTVFFYLALTRDKSNLAMARMNLRDAESQIQI